MSLLSLPDETLANIALLVEVRGSLKDIHKLALASKRLCRACDPIIWRKYEFVIRMSARRDVYGVWCDAPSILDEEWLVRLDRRIAHLREKAPYVRDLSVIDSETACDTLPFAPEVLDRAMVAIRACTGLKKLAVLNTSMITLSAWPAQLWTLIQCELPRLQQLDLGANFANIPKLEGPPRALATLELRWCKGLIDDLLPQDMLLPQTLEFGSLSYERAPPPAEQRFVPSPLLAQQLRTLKAYIPHIDIPGRGFDTVSLAHVEIDIEIYFACDIKAHLPRAWREIKPHLESLVTDDIRAYDVKKERAVHITRPSLIKFPNRKGKHQDQVRDVAKDDEEQAQMDAYYAGKKSSWQW
ncbi:hypothetical protein EXIGLDRAFT_762044 [Exidia glandulosa HHB12029]|uniref:F-box domain-containing protein n=1 Tax=Exidia glandulosa HHB12029 TaxID=1314781 RepID=A0A165N471_EXIGL|nr:hypothetical protein EXIGLDRAFT_762044 [Exidia glandulosa HHB12029]